MLIIELFSFLKYLILQTFGLILAVLAGAALLLLLLRRIASRKIAILVGVMLLGMFLFVVLPSVSPYVSQYPVMLRTFGPADGPALTLSGILKFFGQVGKFERVASIARDPNDVPPPIGRTEPETVKISLVAKEVVSEIAPDVHYNYWTFDGTVPGPFLRVREGDTVELTLKNDSSSLHYHNIDLHAVTGPGGGATITNVGPGEEKTAKFKALNPGLYVYHCAHPNVATHMAHGMYGLILVEPKDGSLPKVDKEFYVMQGELYTDGYLGKKGLQVFDAQAMLDGHAQYVVFNGKVKALADNMKANVGDTVRLYVGNGGVNLISSFHVIGEIFDTVFPEASIGGALLKNVQTTVVPAGGAAITDFKLEVPGNFILVDHALSRLDRGAWGVLQVAGEKNPDIFFGDDGHDHGSHGH
jgi:nitrite reductase (NO-forming)